MEAAERQRGVEAQRKHVDTALDALTDFHDIFGATREARVSDPKKLEEVKRILTTANGIHSAFEGKTPDDPIKMAVAALYPDHLVKKAKAKETAELSQRLRDHRGQFVARPDESKGRGDIKADSLAELEEIIRTTKANGTV